MAPTPVRHPLRHADAVARRRAIAAHPAGRARRRTIALDPDRAVVLAVPPHGAVGAPVGAAETRPVVSSEDGSMTTEYGLIVVVGATICSLVIKWASGGAVFELLGGVLNAAKGLVGF